MTSFRRVRTPIACVAARAGPRRVARTPTTTKAAARTRSRRHRRTSSRRTAVWTCWAWRGWPSPRRARRACARCCPRPRACCSPAAQTGAPTWHQSCLRLLQWRREAPRRRRGPVARAVRTAPPACQAIAWSRGGLAPPSLQRQLTASVRLVCTSLSQGHPLLGRPAAREQHPGGGAAVVHLGHAHRPDGAPARPRRAPVQVSGSPCTHRPGSLALVCSPRRRARPGRWARHGEGGGATS